MKSQIKKAFLASLPVCSGYIVLGIAFGLLLNEAGYGVLWAFIISCFVYAGSMQFILISLLTSKASLLIVVLTTISVNARHLLYGISMLERYSLVKKGKSYLIFTLTDETYSLVCKEKNSTSQYYLWVSFLNHMYWIVGSVLGSSLAQINSFNLAGIEFSMTALFIVVVVEQCLNTNDYMPTILGFVISIGCVLVFGAQNFLIPSMILILAGLSINKVMRGKIYE